MRILLDEQLPRQLAPYLVGHDARTVQQESWGGRIPAGAKIIEFFEEPDRYRLK